jgi:hypothetical protein
MGNWPDSDMSIATAPVNGGNGRSVYGKSAHLRPLRVP